MFDLPRATNFNKRIPKEKFYENLQVDSKIKRSFIEQIKAIYWCNKIAPSTTNLAEGKTVSEIQVIEIKLKTNFLDKDVLYQIDRKIPYHILFLLQYENKYQAWITYKEASSGKTAFKVGGRYYYTDWLDKEDLPLRLEGLNMDTAYENFVYQIAGETLQEGKSESLQNAIEKAEEKRNLSRKIEALRARIRKEKQFNKQVKLNSELKKMEKKMEETNG